MLAAQELILPRVLIHQAHGHRIVASFAATECGEALSGSTCAAHYPLHIGTLLRVLDNIPLIPAHNRLACVTAVSIAHCQNLLIRLR